jgi:hypothetical protein
VFDFKALELVPTITYIVERVRELGEIQEVAMYRIYMRAIFRSYFILLFF